MLPFMRSIMGCAESGPSNAYFYSVSGGEPRTSYSRGCAKYRAWSWGTMPKMRLFKAHFCSLYMASSSGLDRVWSRLFFCDVQKCPELREKWVFYIVGVKFATWRSKSGFRKKGQNIFLVPHPSSFLCFLVSRLVFAKKVFPKSTKFRWNHWKRSAKLARPQNAIFAPKGPKWAILVRVTKRSRYILSLHSPSFRIHLQEDKDNCLIFLAFFLLDNKSLSIILMIELFLCNKYLSFWSWFWSIFLCSCWLCLFFLLVPLLLILLHHSFFLSSI